MLQSVGDQNFFSTSVKERAQHFDSGRASSNGSNKPSPLRLPIKESWSGLPSPAFSTSSGYSSIASSSAGQFHGLIPREVVDSSVKRKPLPQSSFNLHSKSQSTSHSILPAGRSNARNYYPTRSSSLHSPPLTPKHASLIVSKGQRARVVSECIVRDLDRYPRGSARSGSVILPSDYRNFSADTWLRDERTGVVRSSIVQDSPKSGHVNEPRSGLSYESHTSGLDLQAGQEEDTTTSSSTEPNMAASSEPPIRPQLKIEVTRERDGDVSLNSTKAPRSPGVVLGSLFGWKYKWDDDVSSTSSPAISPRPLGGETAAHGEAESRQMIKTVPSSLDIPKANASGSGVYGHSQVQLPTPPATNNQVADLEQELQEISAELAHSIRREMELEDEIDRLKSQGAEPCLDAPGRRSSDYFSDSGASSSRYTDVDGRNDDVEQLKRKSEQEKAQMKLEMSERMAYVLKQRRLAEDRVHLLEEHVQTRERSLSPMFDSDRVRQLESNLKDMERKLVEEKSSRVNMEELIAGMRDEIKEYSADRDNYRDEIVPQLESKLASLELFMSEGQIFAPVERGAENADKDDISSLSYTKAGLLRSRSVAQKRSGPSRPQSSWVAASPQVPRSRANSMRDYSNESRDQLLERVRDTEGQREALHKALRSLLQRYRWQKAEFEKQIRIVEQQRDKALVLTPRRTAFDKEVRNLRDEIAILRRRADEAMDQKWRCEKGLSGLKIDVDRGQQDTSTLRRILEEEGEDVKAISTEPKMEGEALALNKAYEQLQTTHALSVVHLRRELETRPDTDFDGDEALDTLALLKKSISDTEAERDAAQHAADKYRDQARQLQESELGRIGKEKHLATELYTCTSRMDELAAQVRAQINTNSLLRQRLVDAVERGEREQNSSASRIAALQGRLKELEERLIVAQQASDEAMSGHEEDIKLLGQGKREQLHRSDKLFGHLPASPAGSPSLGWRSPSSLFAVRSPKLTMTSSGASMSMSQATGTHQLEKRVKELERALSEAEAEMTEVVGRMNMAQMEVANLQSERDQATQNSKRLQNEIVAERTKVKLVMNKS